MADPSVVDPIVRAAAATVTETARTGAGSQDIRGLRTDAGDSEVGNSTGSIIPAAARSARGKTV